MKRVNALSIAALLIFSLNSCKSRTFGENKKVESLQKTNLENATMPKFNPLDFDSILANSHKIADVLQSRRGNDRNSDFDFSEFMPVLKELTKLLEKRIKQFDDGDEISPQEKWSFGNLSTSDSKIANFKANRRNPNINCMNQVFEQSETLKTEQSVTYQNFWMKMENLLTAIDGCRYDFSINRKTTDSIFIKQATSHGILIPAWKANLTTKNFVRLADSFLYPVDIVVYPSNADGNMLAPFKFAYHDIGHAEVMNAGNRQICSDKTNEILEWYKCAIKIRDSNSKIISHLESWNSEKLWEFIFEDLHETGNAPNLAERSTLTDLDAFARLADLQPKLPLKETCKAGNLPQELKTILETNNVFKEDNPESLWKALVECLKLAAKV